MVNSNILALDLGEKRIGVALADIELRLPQPLITLDTSEAIETIPQLIDKYQIKTVVVGYPRNQSGQPTAQTKWTESFMGQLTLPESIDVVWQDESLTSIEAHNELSQRGRSYAKADVDSLAATYILQDYIKENYG